MPTVHAPCAGSTDKADSFLTAILKDFLRAGYVVEEQVALAGLFGVVTNCENFRRTVAARHDIEVDTVTHIPRIPAGSTRLYGVGDGVGGFKQIVRLGLTYPDKAVADLADILTGKGLTLEIIGRTARVRKFESVDRIVISPVTVGQGLPTKRRKHHGDHFQHVTPFHN